MNALRFPSLLRASIVAVCAALSSVGSLLAVPAFPGAEGFGANATGGRGGSVYRVINLNDSGAGSFRDAVSVANRTVVFDVGGIITLTSGRVAVKNNITIAGQTAPGEGITIYGNGVSFSNASNTICRYIRFRQGINGDSGTDAVGIASGNDMIFDHVSASWGRDETFSVSGSPSNITLQDCVVGQGLLIHSAGGLMQTDGGVSVFRSLYVDNWMRNPKVKGVHEFTNNVVYNWGSGGGYIAGDSAGQSYTNIVGNYFSAGPNTGTTPAFIRGNLNFHVYAADNIEDANKNGVADGVVVQPLDQTPVDPQAVRYPYPAVAQLLTPQQAFNHVLAYAGASLHRDSVDAYMVNEVLSHGTAGAHINSESEMGGVGTIAGGLAPADADADGMPDWWELAAGTNPAVADNNGDLDGDGYTNLENYINALTVTGVPGAIITGIFADTGVVGTDGNTSDTTLALVGTAAPGTTITVRRVDLGVIGTAVADVAGQWAFDYTGTTLVDSYYVFTATGTVDGKESPASRGFVVRVDTTPAATPAITSLVISPDYVFNGTAEPNVTVSVILVGVGPVATTVANGLGNWSAAYTGAPLSAGVYSFTASATDLAGNTGADSAAYVVDTGLTPPVFTGIVSDSGYSATDQITNDTAIILNGTAPASSTVAITRVGVGVVGTVVADASGVWTFNYTATVLPAAQHTFTATASAGGSSSPASNPFLVTVDTAKPSIPSLARLNPATANTAASTLVFRVTMNEPVINVDLADFSLTKTPASITGAITSVVQVSPSVYDVTVTGVSGDGTIRVDRPASATITDYAGNTTNTSFTGGQAYTLRLPGSGVWSTTESGLWSDIANWEAGVIANSSGATADFATRDLDGESVVTFDAPRTLGRIVFADTDVGSPGNWKLTNAGNAANILTLATSGVPTIQVIHTGDTGVTNPTLATTGQLVPAIIDLPVVSSTTLEKTGWGTAVFTQPASVTGALNVSQGVLKIGAGGSMTNTTVAVGNSSQLHVSGGVYTATGITTITNGGFSGVYVSDGTANFQRITNTGDRDGLVKVTGGTLNIAEMLIPRSSSADVTLTNVASVYQYGFIAQGGTANLGTFSLGSGNSWAFASIEDGEVNIAGSATIAWQATSNRGGRLRMLGGRLNVADTIDGLVMARKNGTNANNIAALYLFGGVATMPKLTLGYDATVTGGYGLVSLEGGSLFLGSGGLVKNGTFATYINLFSGVLGAQDSWSSSVPMALVATGTAAIRAADEAGNARDITLSGVLGDWSGTMPAANLQNPGQVAAGGPGGFRKTGAGTLTLAADNTFTGDVVIEQGTLAVTGSLAAGGTVLINDGGVLTVTGVLNRGITLGDGGRIAPGVAGVGTVTGSSLTWNAGGSVALNLDVSTDSLVLSGALLKGTAGAYAFACTAGPAFAAGNIYTVASFGSTDFVAADFSATGLPAGFAASFAIVGNTVQMTIVGTPFITSADSAAGMFGSAFSYTITAGNVPTGFSVSSLPPGLVLDAATGIISGTPTAAGTYTIVIGATNIAGTGSAPLAITIAKAPATVTLTDLLRSYDGTPRNPTATTVPADLNVVFTYDGSNPAPTYPGTYAVTATIDEANYEGSVAGTFVLAATATVRHAPVMNGDVDGSVQMLLGEYVTLNGGAMISSDLLVPGTPTMRLNGKPVFGGTIDATGNITPTNYSITLNGNAVLRYAVRRIDPLAMPVVSAPAQPAGNRYVNLNKATDPIGDFATLRNLTLNGNVGAVAVPAGTYGDFTANGNGGFVLGVAGATEPSVYSLQRLTMNGSATLQIVGPVVLRLANGINFNGSGVSGSPAQSFTILIASGDLTLNGSVTLNASVVVPSGRVTINGSAKLNGRVTADNLTLNGNAQLNDPEL